MLLTRRDGILRIRPVHARQIVERDADTPPVRRAQHQHHAEDSEGEQPEQPLTASLAEVDEDDNRRDRQAIADDRERPRVAGIALVDEAADRAPVEVVRPAGKQRPFAAVRTALADAAAQGREDHCTTVSVTSKISVAFGGMLADGLWLP